jgi:hypothetical protein
MAGEIKSPRAAVWLIYLNLVTKGVLCILRQAGKLKGKLVYPPKTRTRLYDPNSRQIECWLK